MIKLTPEEIARIMATVERVTGEPPEDSKLPRRETFGPPEEVAEELFKLIRHRSSDEYPNPNRERINKLKAHLRKEFMAEWNLKGCHASKKAIRQIFGLQSDHGRGPWLHDVTALGGRHLLRFDHDEFMFRERGGSGYVIVNQPYDVTDEVRAEWQSLADRTGSWVKFPDFPSWWYPTRTTPILHFRPEPYWFDIERWTGLTEDQFLDRLDRPRLRVINGGLRR